MATTLRQLVLERDSGICAMCGTGEEPWEADHIHPRSKGGPDSLENLRTLCKPCHRKHTKECKLSGNGLPTGRIPVRIPVEVQVGLRKFCAEMGTTESSLLRRLASDFVRRSEEVGPFRASDGLQMCKDHLFTMRKDRV